MISIHIETRKFAKRIGWIEVWEIKDFESRLKFKEDINPNEIY